MTRARRTGKARLAWGLIGFALILAPLTAIGGVATTERMVIDWRTGLAISGFDPVAYFTEAKPALGRAELEFTFGGATWRFRNFGNRAAFMANPEVYMPRLGGYDPVRAANGLGVQGNPQVWLIVADRLYLFYDEKNRAKFLRDPGRHIIAATRKWPLIVRTLSP